MTRLKYFLQGERTKVNTCIIIGKSTLIFDILFKPNGREEKAGKTMHRLTLK